MNIIFGDHLLQEFDNHTILELDTVRFPDGHRQTAWCVIATIPLSEFSLVDAHKKIHHDLMDAYRKQHWNYCLQAIEGLTGKWGGEVDTFYTTLANRIKVYQEQGVPDGWDGSIMTTSPQS